MQRCTHDITYLMTSGCTVPDVCIQACRAPRSPVVLGTAARRGAVRPFLCHHSVWSSERRSDSNIQFAMPNVNSLNVSVGSYDKFYFGGDTAL